jgi:hypothetical protein
MSASPPGPLASVTSVAEAIARMESIQATTPEARDLAWANALLLGELRDEPMARGLFLDGLAGQVALASRLLLVAV